MPVDSPDAILDVVNEERLRLHYEAELAYLRGDFELIKQYYRKTEGDDASRIRACSVTIAAAISTGDYPFYSEIENFLKGIVKTTCDEGVIAFAELCLSNACLSALAPNMAPDWLKNGDFATLHSKLKPDAAYKRAKYFQSLGQFNSMLAIAETALAYSGSGKREITFHDIYFRVVCAIACCFLDRKDQAKRWLSESLEIALPHGFITPFAESVPNFGGLLQKLLEREYPAYVDTITKQWESTFPNWLSFHNHFTKNNITLILSLQEYQMAKLAAQEISFKQIAEQFHISLGTLNNKMQIIYKKLSINGKKELSQYIL
jgi:DNA-binding CsgD family transcriptional regulator